jgi:hypothetical protein
MINHQIKSEHHPRCLPRHELSRAQYRLRRYARHLSQSELNGRIRDIFLNFLILTNGAKIALRQLDAETAGWLEKFTHMLEEMQLRHGPYPSGFTRDILHSEPLPDFISDFAKRAAKKIASLGSVKGDALIKLGKRQHMEALYETGALRVQPATRFRDNDLRGALRDDELGMAFSVVLSRDEIVKVVVNKQDVPVDAPDQRIDVQYRWTSDYWVYCLTSSVEPRLFVDFDADACVIIRHRSKFREMLRKASEPKLRGAVMGEGTAIYLDPVLPHLTDIFVPLAKHFRYSYQREYRFYWLPPTQVNKVSFVDISIGSLRDIAELVVL